MIFMKEFLENIDFEKNHQTAKRGGKNFPGGKELSSWKSEVIALIHISPWCRFCGTLANSAKPDQMPQNAASDQVLHCLLTGVSFKI